MACVYFHLGKVPGHWSFPQELTSVPLPGHCLLTVPGIPVRKDLPRLDPGPDQRGSMGSESSMESQFLSLVLSPPPQDCEQELQALHCVHSGAVVNIFCLSCRNIHIREFCAEIFKSGCVVQKHWSVIAAKYRYELPGHARLCFVILPNQTWWPRWSLKSQGRRQNNVVYVIVQI